MQFKRYTKLWKLKLCVSVSTSNELQGLEEPMDERRGLPGLGEHYELQGLAWCLWQCTKRWPPGQFRIRSFLRQFLWNVLAWLLRVACESVVSGPCCFATSFMASSNPGHAASFLEILWLAELSSHFMPQFSSLPPKSLKVIHHHRFSVFIPGGLIFYVAPRICSFSEMAALGPEGGVLGVHFPVKAPGWLFKMNGTGLLSHFLIAILKTPREKLRLRQLKLRLIWGMLLFNSAYFSKLRQNT